MKKKKKKVKEIEKEKSVKSAKPPKDPLTHWQGIQANANLKVGQLLFARQLKESKSVLED